MLNVPDVVPVVVDETVPVALVDVTVVPVPASSCIVTVIFVFAISNNWFLIGIKSLTDGLIVNSSSEPVNEFGLNDDNEM